MKTTFYSLFIISILTSGKLYSQTDSFMSSRDTVYTLVGDTLFTNTGIRIVVGQSLTVGKGSDENGWYASMSFKSPFNWSLWLFRDKELNNSTNPSRVDAAWERERYKLRDYFYEGDSVLVKKIRKKGNKKYGYWYAVYIKTYKFPKAKFICNIKLAIKNREIIIK